jgi:tetratricopeptide (TPR) repeat protein
VKAPLFALLMALAIARAWGGEVAPDLAAEKAQRHYETGLQMLSQARFIDAAEELGVAAILEPQREDIQGALKQARKGGQAPAQAAEASALTGTATSFDSGMARKNSEPILTEARQAYRESDLNHASDAWTRALLVDKDSQEAKAGLSKLSDEAYKKDPDQPFDSSVAELYAEALREARKERFVEARKKLEQALTLNPAQEQVKALLSEIESGAFVQQGSRDAAEALAEGQRALNAGDWIHARLSLDKALRLKPEDRSSLAALESLNEKSAPWVKDWLAKASKASRQGDSAGAKIAFQRVLAVAPEDPDALEGLKKAEKRLKREKGQASVKQKADALYNEGVEAWQSGRLGFAATCFRDAVDLVPGDVEALKALDLVRSKLAAQSDKDKEQSAALLKQARILEDQGKLKEALEALERAAAKDLGNSQAAAEAGRLRKQLHGK